MKSKSKICEYWEWRTYRHQQGSLVWKFEYNGWIKYYIYILNFPLIHKHLFSFKVSE